LNSSVELKLKPSVRPLKKPNRGLTLRQLGQRRNGLKRMPQKRLPLSSRRSCSLKQKRRI
jgi:hypothetical protein